MSVHGALYKNDQPNGQSLGPIRAFISYFGAKFISAADDPTTCINLLPKGLFKLVNLH